MSDIQPPWTDTYALRGPGIWLDWCRPLDDDYAPAEAVLGFELNMLRWFAPSIRITVWRLSIMIGWSYG